MSEPANPEVVILNAALELSPSERAAYLDKACAGDAALRQRVEELLGAHDQAGGFLESPPACLDFKRIVPANVPLTEKPGDRIGRYKLLQQIGEGGCGVVYMAEQEEPVRRRVALKVIKLGMDTKSVIARFEAERQALALMDHPNIAKVLEAGATETGRPFFVMELVRGIKITDFCDENKVSTEDRLKLFIQVCQAIQHAHQKGIIHRDIKPSNILVTINDGVPVPKVIDFGIAKATQGKLTDKTLFTAFEQFIGTPAYMSPEQAVMTSLDIDTRSDIYSLGVLLYELLTGKTPFDTNELLKAGLDAMRRTIREIEPPKPSTRLTQELVAADVRRLHSKSEVRDLKSEEEVRAFSHRLLQVKELIHVLRGDLDWIVMKSLEKDRARRYETANGFAADIQRHLNNEPVSACPPSGLYRFQKAVQRNKGAFTAAAAIAMVMVTGVIVSTSQTIRAKRAEQEQIHLREQAEAEAAKSEQTAQFLKDMLNGAGPSVARGRDTTLLREILDKTAERVGKDLTNQPEVQGDLWLVLGNTYSDIGDRTNVIVMYEQAVKNYRRAFSGDHAKLAIALGELGSSQSFVTNVKEGTNNAGLGLQMARNLGDEKTIAHCLVRYAVSLNSWGKGIEAAEPYLREALAIRQKEGTNDALMSIYSRLALSGTNVVEREKFSRAVLNYRLQKNGEDNTYVASQRFIHGQTLLLLERPGEAEVELQKTLVAWRKFYPAEHPFRGLVFRYFINSLALQGKWDEAEGEIQQEDSLLTTSNYRKTIAVALNFYRDGDWSRVLTNFPRLQTTTNLFDASIILAFNGRAEDYRARAHAFLKQANEKRDFTIAERAAKTALLFPPDEGDLALAGDLADFATTGATPKDSVPWAKMTKSLAEYRRGRYEAAIEWADKSLAITSVEPSCHAAAYFVQALAQTRLKSLGGASAAYNNGHALQQKYLERIIVQEYWNVSEFWRVRDWLIADFLRHEAEERLAEVSKSSKSAR